MFRWALTRVGSYYYIAPYQKQAKELLWANNRLPGFLPKYVTKINNSEMRLTLTNGSFIKLDGADNFDSYRGVNPHGIAYDEFKDHKAEFHAAMAPNLATYKAPLVIVGTPPDETEIPSDEEMENERHPYDLMRDITSSNKDCAYFNYPTWVNPAIDRDWLKIERSILFARGDEAEWYREYEAKRVSGGRDNIFPMFDKKHCLAHEELMELVYKDAHRMRWLCIADPGSSTCFAVLFMAVHPYQKKIYILDELYVKRLEETSTSQMIPRIRGKIQDIFSLWPTFRYKDKFEFYYDEAAAWFAAEAIASFDMPWTPTSKAQNKKEEGLSLIKDQLVRSQVLISKRCKYLTWEAANYKRDPKTKKIPKKNDHLLDCWRYGNAAAGFSLVKEHAPEDRDAWRRFSSIERDARIIGIEDSPEITQVDPSALDPVILDYD
jgi:hypothetical protein